MKRKGSQNAQHVICAKVKCGERERESRRGTEKNLLFVDKIWRGEFKSPGA